MVFLNDMRGSKLTRVLVCRPVSSFVSRDTSVIPHPKCSFSTLISHRHPNLYSKDTHDTEFKNPFQNICFTRGFAWGAAAGTKDVEEQQSVTVQGCPTPNYGLTTANYVDTDGNYY
jgi:hypothetical protein